ncbi:hypothetical protein AB0D66_21355 [Streptomyces sp. NPDC048270]|uniref:hypothetical protein n=1 Tax=Streptomyces sp. NPDC048270 TaxID=3154615 RepID=UPI0033D9FF85
MSTPRRSLFLQAFRMPAVVLALAGFALVLYEAMRGVGYPGWVYPAAIAVMLVVLGAEWLLRGSAVPGRQGGGSAGRTTGGRPAAVGRMDVQLIVVFALLAWFAMRNVLDGYESSGRLGPQDAPDLLVAGGALSAFLTAVSLAVSRVLRAEGAQRHARGQGAQAEYEGQAAAIRAEAEGRAAQVTAEYEGRAALMRAEAERLRAEAEYLRAEKGLEPLPGPGPDPAGPPAVEPGPGPHGSPGAGPPAPPREPGDDGTP